MQVSIFCRHVTVINHHATKHCSIVAIKVTASKNRMILLNTTVSDEVRVLAN